MMQICSHTKNILTRFSFLYFLCTFWFSVQAQKKQPSIAVTKQSGENKINVTVNGRPFTTFFYPDSLEKPVLFPIHAPDGQIITRGFPLQPRPGEPVDHPHHIGLWFNYESVNGLDFWNNSFAIAAEKKHRYGWIRTDSNIQTKSGTDGRITYTARWEDIKKNVLLKEQTTFIFRATGNQRIIDRLTTLTAEQDVVFNDVKDGLIALRIARELQIPEHDTNRTSNGNYITSEGKQGNSVWGTPASWCLLYGKMGTDTISIAIIDHPANPGYPAFWHARGYGLFAANPLGKKVFTNGADSLQLHLNKGEAVTFRYRVVLASGKQRLSNEWVTQQALHFKKNR